MLLGEWSRIWIISHGLVSLLDQSGVTLLGCLTSNAWSKSFSFMLGEFLILSHSLFSEKGHMLWFTHLCAIVWSYWREENHGILRGVETPLDKCVPLLNVIPFFGSQCVEIFVITLYALSCFTRAPS